MSDAPDLGESAASPTDTEQRITDAQSVRSISFDRLHVDRGGGVQPDSGLHRATVTFTYSARDSNDLVLELFRTQLVLDLLPRALTRAEEFALLCFGVVHSNYVQLPFLPVGVHKLQVRAGHLTPEQLQFFETKVFPGALAEYAHLCGLDVRGLVELSCPVPAEDVSPEGAWAQGAAPGVQQPRPPRVMVPFGGGKDSTLLAELLHRMGASICWCYMGEWDGSWGAYSKFEQLAQHSPSTRVLKAEQSLPDTERLLRLNQRPQLHFPDYVSYVSFYVFVAAFFALQHDYDFICVGNEHSANAINLIDPVFGFEVNHQYEKSFAAELSFHTFLRAHVAPSLWYFSGLQHMSELEIAGRFSLACKQYLPFILSCNWATDDAWCGACEKCAFVYLLFSAFLELSTLRTQVFSSPAPAGRAPGAQASSLTSMPGCSPPGAEGDSLDSKPKPSRLPAAEPVSGRVLPAHVAQPKPSLPGERPPEGGPGLSVPVASSLADHEEPLDSLDHLPLFESLMGVHGHKPLECVGTPEEVLAALYLAHQRHYACTSGDGISQQYTSGRPLPLLMQKHLKLITTRGAEHWAALRARIAAADVGDYGVPHLYPSWYRIPPDVRFPAGDL